MFQTTSQRRTSHTFIVCHQKKTSLFIGSTCFLHGILARCGDSANPGHPRVMNGAPILWVIGAHRVFCEKKNGFPICFETKMLFLWFFLGFLPSKTRCFFHVGLVVVLQGLSQHLQRGPNGFGGRLQGAHVLRTQRCGNGEQTDSMVITMV